MPAIDFVPQIPFVQEDQQGDNLCWIAVAVSVKRHFEPASHIKQCGLARALLPVSGSCCSTAGGTRPRCDRPGRLEEALDHVSHLGPDTSAHPNPEHGRMTFEEIRDQIDNHQLPVCIYIQWRGGGIGHFISISGHHESGGERYLFINDPLYGDGPQTYNRVAFNYQLQGSWEYTYRLRA